MPRIPRRASRPRRTPRGSVREIPSEQDAMEDRHGHSPHGVKADGATKNPAGAIGRTGGAAIAEFKHTPLEQLNDSQYIKSPEGRSIPRSSRSKDRDRTMRRPPARPGRSPRREGAFHSGR